MVNLFSFSLFLDCFPRLLSRLHITLFIVAVSIVFGLLLGVILAAVRLYRIPVLSQLAVAYVSFIRGIPILVLLFIVYIGLPLVVQQFGVNINRWDTLIFVMISYSLNTAAFLSEVIRASVTAVEKGQTEAACSVGMTKIQAFVRIVWPQAIQIAIPSLGNTVVSLLKDTSLAYTVGVIDVIGIIKSISIRTTRSLEAYAASAIIFFLLSTIFEQFFKYIDRRLGAGSSVPGQRRTVDRKIAVKAG